MKAQRPRPRLACLAVLLPTLAAPALGAAADPEYRSVASVARQRPATEGERIERAITRLQPGMDRDEAAKTLGVERLLAESVASTLQHSITSYYVGQNQRLIVGVSLTNNGRRELTLAELLRGGRTVAKFPASK